MFVRPCQVGIVFIPPLLWSQLFYYSVQDHIIQQWINRPPADPKPHWPLSLMKRIQATEDLELLYFYKKKQARIRFET
jgi:hypothetical protein